MRILFITARPPWPGFRGDQARPAGWIRHLASRHEIRVVSQRWPGFSRAEPPPGVELDSVDISRVNIARAALRGALGAATGSVRPVQVALFDHVELRREVRAQVDGFQPDVAVVLLSRLADVLPELEGIPTVLDFVDALSLNMAHRARCEPRLAALWRRESRAFETWDHRALARVDAGLVVAERDRQAILQPITDAEARRLVAQKLQVLPFGLDLAGRSADRARPDDHRLVLTGNLGYFPTVDGACWFADEIWPAVQSRCPDAVWQLAGARPSTAILELGRRPGVRVTPNPDDLGAVRRGATIAVAPLRSGSGTPIKILEAMAAGIPVVTTPEGAEGLDELPTSAIEVARGAEDFADRIVRLLGDREWREHLVAEAWTWLEARHDLSALAREFEGLLRRLANR